MIEQLCLSALIHNEEFFNTALPHLKSEYFETAHERAVFEAIEEIANEYKTRATQEALRVVIESSSVSDEIYSECLLVIDGCAPSDTDTQFLIDKTEDWCKNRSLHIGLSEAIEIADGEENKSQLNTTAIPKILSDALSVSFDTEVGLDYYANVEAQHEYYHSEDSRIPFPLNSLNALTRGGYKKKSLNIVQAGINVGKTTFLVWLAAESLKAGMNVLYISMEIDEMTVAERVDTSFLDVDFDHLHRMSKDAYLAKHKTNQDKYGGKMLIKEYPADTANANHFRYVLNEAKLKKNFTPDLIIIDYLTICSSVNKKPSTSNSDDYYTSVASELRALSQEFDIPVWTASQLTRSGQTSDNVTISDGGLSLGIAKTADFMFAIMQPESLADDNTVICKIIKNRYSKRAGVKKFPLILDNDKQQIRDPVQVDPRVSSTMSRVGNSDKQLEKWRT